MCRTAVQPYRALYEQQVQQFILLLPLALLLLRIRSHIMPILRFSLFMPRNPTIVSQIFLHRMADEPYTLAREHALTAFRRLH